MAYVARKRFLFKGTEYVAGDVVPAKVLDKYQRETFLRVGFVVEAPEAPDRKLVRRKPVEVKPLEDAQV